MTQYTVLGASAGNGVMLHPFKDQFLLGNAEIRTDYYIGGRTPQWDLNFPGIQMGDILKVGPKVNVIVGHPKCGLSSMLALSRGKSFKSHQGEPSLDLFFRAIDMFQPYIFFLENLPKLLETYSLVELKSRFPKYSFSQIIDSVSIWGNSQFSRKRLLIIGYQDSPSIMHPHILKLLENPPQNLPKTGELLKGPLDNGHYREDLDDRIAIYGGRQMTFREIKEYWDANPTKKRFETDNHLGSAPGVYRNLEDDYPATVRKGNREFNPKGLPMSPRERARIQGIPDDFLLLDPDDYPHMSYKTLLNKSRVTVANTPPYQVGAWIKKVCDSLFIG